MRLHQLLALSLLIGVQGQTTDSNKTLKLDQTSGPKPHLVVFLANAKVIDHSDNQTSYVNPFQRMIQFFLSNILRDFTVDHNETASAREKKDVWSDIKEGTVNISVKAYNATKKGYEFTKKKVEDAAKDITKRSSSDEERCLHGELGFCKACTKRSEKRKVEKSPVNETIKKRHYFLSISGDTDKRVAAANSLHVAGPTRDEVPSRLRRNATAGTQLSRFPTVGAFNPAAPTGTPSSSPTRPARGAGAVDSLPGRFANQDSRIQTGHEAPAASKFGSILDDASDHVPGETLTAKVPKRDLMYANRESQGTTITETIFNVSANENSRMRGGGTLPTNQKSTVTVSTGSANQQLRIVRALQLRKTISAGSTKQGSISEPMQQTRFGKALANASGKLSILQRSTNQISQKTVPLQTQATPARKQSTNQKLAEGKALRIPSRSTNHRPRKRRGDDFAPDSFYLPFDFGRWYRNVVRVGRADPPGTTPSQEVVDVASFSGTGVSPDGNEDDEEGKGHEEENGFANEDDMEFMTEPPLAPPHQVIRPKVKAEYSSFTYFLTVTLPTVLFFAAIIIGMCFVFRMNGVCCKLFLTIPSEEQNRPRRKIRVLRIRRKKKKEKLVVANA